MLSSIILFTCLHKIFTRQTQDKQHICVYVKDYGILIPLKKDYYCCKYTTNISIQTNNLDIVLHADACVCSHVGFCIQIYPNSLAFCIWLQNLDDFFFFFLQCFLSTDICNQILTLMFYVR